MADKRSDPKSSCEYDRRTLELQLIKTQREASAARLEARAAELELMIRRLGGQGAVASLEWTDPPVIGSSIAEVTSADFPAPPMQRPANPPDRPAPPSSTDEARFSDWNEVRAALLNAMEADAPRPAETILSDTITRKDAGERNQGRLEMLDRPSEPDPQHADPVAAITVQEPASAEPADTGDQSCGDMLGEASDVREPRVSGEVLIDSNRDEDAQRSRGRPAAWMVSAAGHVGVLLILAAVGLQTKRPRDQVALSASTTAPSETQFESLVIESSEPETEPVVPHPTETQLELSPVGQLAATEFAPSADPAPPVPVSGGLPGHSVAPASAMSVESDSDARIQFCGVEGGGNHFVYLVDSSGSMGEGFESARRELLASIQVLKPHQRFYVVFFDAKPDYMRLGNSSFDEPRSVYATPENKAAVKRWAMRISMDRGRAPYEPLRFALKLRPDVIFLLSDGEFPQGIEELLQNENRVQNLFGDSHPISIVHTISYHSQEGENRMRRIALQNHGQYRHIPKP